MNLLIYFNFLKHMETFYSERLYNTYLLSTWNGNNNSRRSGRYTERPSSYPGTCTFFNLFLSCFQSC